MKKIILILAAALLVAAGAQGATIVIVNADGPGEGFNDNTPATPVGGNPGTTIGQQRLNLFQEAANIWGDLLVSNVTIRVQSSFGCSLWMTRPSPHRVAWAGFSSPPASAMLCAPRVTSQSRGVDESSPAACPSLPAGNPWVAA